MRDVQRQALEAVLGAVREAVRRSETPPKGSALEALVRRVAGEEVRKALARGSPVGDPEGLVKAALDEVTGFGPLQPYLDDPEVEEIWVNAPDRVFVSRGGKNQLTGISVDAETLRDLVERMLRWTGRRLDLSSPFVDATLPDGSRLHVVIPDITREHWAVNIRKYSARLGSMAELVARGSLSSGAARFLEAAVRSGLNILVAGATQAGKTTTLNCLASAIPPDQRVITCEEVFELRLASPDWVALQTRQPNLEGKGEVNLRRLVREAMRMRPDRIIVGEVRGEESFDLLLALNAGLPGMATIHANSAREALSKLATLCLLAGENVTHRFLLPIIATSVHLVVFLRRQKGERRVTEILGVTGRVEGEVVEASPIFLEGETGLRWTGSYPPRQDLFQQAGYHLPSLLSRGAG